MQNLLIEHRHPRLTQAVHRVTKALDLVVNVLGHPVSLSSLIWSAS